MDGFIDALSPEAEKRITAYNKQVIELIGNIGKASSVTVGGKTPSQTDSAIKDLNTQLLKQDEIIKKLQEDYLKLAETEEKVSRSKKTQTQIILDQAKSYQSLAAQREKAIAQNAKEELAQAKLENAYERVKAKIASTLPLYNDLKTKSELGITLNSKQEKQLAVLEGRLVRYREVLNSVNKSYGNYSLEVGNYAKGTSNLSNSIGQISRELPNFGQSFSVGVLSLTNNVGALIDSVKQVREQNVLLKNEGKPTVSVLSQVTSALLSWQTALFIGIGILSAYSKEIGDWTSSLFEGNKQLKELNENQEAVNNSRITGRKDAQAEILELKKYISVVNNVKASALEKQIAEEAVFKQYPFYVKNIKDLSVENGKYSKGVSELILALEKRKQVESATEKNVKNSQALIDLQEELKALKKIEAQTKSNLDLAVNRGANPQAIAGLSQVYAKYYNQRLEKEADIKKFTDAIYKNDQLIFKLKGETIGLEYSETEAVKKKQKDQENYDENSITALENQIKNLEEVKGKVDASSYAYSLLDFQVKLLENTLKAMKGEFNSLEPFIKPEQVIDADAVGLEIDEVKRKIADLSRDLEKVLNDAYGYSNELGQSFSGAFDGLTKEQQDKFKDLAAQYAEALDEGDTKTAESLKARLDMYNAYGNTIKQYQNEFVNNIVQGSGFESTFALLNGQIDGFGENAKVTALAVTESFQEMFAFIQKMSQENFDAQRENLRQETEIAIAFAGDSESAITEIRRQAAEKEKEIRRREFNAKKEQARFNIIIDTAQAVVAALPNIPLSILIGALGLAQLSLVNSQKLPEFYKGTENAPKGWAWTQERGQELILDKNNKVKSYGNNKGAQLTKLDAGDKVKTADETKRILSSSLIFDNQLNNIMANNGISSPIVVQNNSSGFSPEQMNRLASIVESIPQPIIGIDKNGLKTYTRNGHSQKEILNNHVTFNR